MKSCIYWIISENAESTYIGFTDNLKRRIKEHRNKKVKSTKNFENFRAYIIEKGITGENNARKREKYWKSGTGRKKLKKFFVN